MRGKRGNRKLSCSGCGQKLSEAHDYNEREVRDLPLGEYRTTIVIEVYRVCGPNCGVEVEKVPPLPSKAPFIKRFEEVVGQACECMPVRQVVRHFRLVASALRAIDLRYVKRWEAARRRVPLKEMGVDGINLGKTMKLITVVSNLESTEPVWFGPDCKQETLDESTLSLYPFPEDRDNEGPAQPANAKLYSDLLRKTTQEGLLVF